MSQSEENDPPPERKAAKEQLVSTVAASWGARAAERAIPRIKVGVIDAETQAVLDELARGILAEATRRFEGDPVLAEIWREAANEAACARLSAVEWGHA